MCAVLLLFSVFFVLNKQDSPEVVIQNHDDSGGLVQDEIQPDPVKVLIKQMSPEEKIGQMFMFGFANEEIEEWKKEFLGEMHIGGVLLLRRNIKDQAQLRTLIKSLQERVSNKEIPLLVAVDQEGGKVNTVYFADETRGGRIVRDEKMAQNIGFIRARELRDLGINVNLAPVLDVVKDPQSFLYERSLPGGAENIAHLGRAIVRGQKEGGIISVAKHFPGHGVSAVDSHKELPISVLTLKELDKTHLVPFQAAVKEGVEMVMLAHLFFPNIDKPPVPLSSIFIKDILRDTLGFRGVIITDDLEMGAILNTYSMGEAVILAVEAGVDILMIGGIFDNQKIGFDALLGAVRYGRISKERIDESVYRILTIKQSVSSSQ